MKRVLSEKKISELQQRGAVKTKDGNPVKPLKERETEAVRVQAPIEMVINMPPIKQVMPVDIETHEVIKLVNNSNKALATMIESMMDRVTTMLGDGIEGSTNATKAALESVSKNIQPVMMEQPAPRPAERRPWEFSVVRDNDGFISKITATPVGE